MDKTWLLSHRFFEPMKNYSPRLLIIFLCFTYTIDRKHILRCTNTCHICRLKENARAQRPTLFSSKPSKAHAAMTCITLRWKRSKATAAAKAIRAETQSNDPA